MPKPRTITHLGTAQVFKGRIGTPSKPEPKPMIVEAELLAKKAEEEKKVEEE